MASRLSIPSLSHPLLRNQGRNGNSPIERVRLSDLETGPGFLGSRASIVKLPRETDMPRHRAVPAPRNQKTRKNTRRLETKPFCERYTVAIPPTRTETGEFRFQFECLIRTNGCSIGQSLLLTKAQLWPLPWHPEVHIAKCKTLLPSLHVVRPPGVPARSWRSRGEGWHHAMAESRPLELSTCSIVRPVLSMALCFLLFLHFSVPCNSQQGMSSPAGWPRRPHETL